MWTGLVNRLGIGLVLVVHGPVRGWRSEVQAAWFASAVAPVVDGLDPRSQMPLSLSERAEANRAGVTRHN